MHKKYTRRRDKLRAEIASLRKGNGITPARIHDKPLLREAVAQAMGIEGVSITNSQAHNFLLTEISKLPHTVTFTALRYAFSLADEAKTDTTLFQRRRRLASSLGKHPDTIIRYENQAIGDLTTRLDELGKNTVPIKSPNNGGSLQILKRLDTQSTVIRDTAILNLTGLLPVANRAPELIRYLEQSQRPYLDVNVEVKFLPSSRGTNWYRLDVKYIFAGMRDTFRLAIVVETQDGEQLMTGGLIDEFHKLNDQIDPRQEIRTILNNSRFTAYNHAINRQKLFRFSELESAQTDMLLQSVGEPLKAQCRLLEVTIPPKWQSEEITYEYRSTFNLRDDIHYAYWYAPNMMHIKKLTFDYSSFPEIERWNFVTMPFLGNVAGNSIRGEHSFTVRPNSWIMPGHGIALIWEVKEPTHKQ